MDVDWDSLGEISTQFPSHSVGWKELDCVLEMFELNSLPENVEKKETKKQVTNKENRKEVLLRWQIKKRRLSFRKKHRYLVRSVYANSRPRIGGKFISMTDSEKNKWRELLVKGFSIPDASKKLEEFRKNASS